MFLVTLQTVLTNQSVCSYGHRLLLLKLDKQIGGTIYRPILAANEACHVEGVGAKLEGVGTVNMPWHASLDAELHH